MSAPTVFRKRPVEVTAIEWTGLNATAVVEFVGPIPASGAPGFAHGDMAGAVWAEHEQCWVNVPVGHWVVRGALGEFYPISPSALAATYERVTT